MDLYGDRVYGFALKNTQHEDDAHDVVQEAYEKLWRKHEEVDFEKCRAYLFSTTYHCIIDHFRKVKKMNALPTTGDELEYIEGQIEDRQWIEEGLNRMTEQERTLILLRDHEGYSYEEIAEMTGLTLSQVKVYLFRARKKFREWLIDLDKVNQVI